MDNVNTQRIVLDMIDLGTRKSKLTAKDILIRSFLSGAFLAYATILAFTAEIQTTFPVVGALFFPVGFVMIVLLGLELVTGNFAVIPVSVLEDKTNSFNMMRNWLFAFLGNLLGSVFLGFLFFIYISQGNSNFEAPIIQKIMKVGIAKTIAYKDAGSMGLLFVFIKGVLCNWMVTLGVVMGLSSTSTSGKILAMWLPIFTFFALGLEHCVVNMFVIPTAIFFHAPIEISDWWLWNQIPSTLGNLVGGFFFTGYLLYTSYKEK